MRLRHQLSLIVLPVAVTIAYQVYSQSARVENAIATSTTVIEPLLEKERTIAEIEFLSARMGTFFRSAVISLYAGNKEDAQEAIQKNLRFRARRQAELQRLQELAVALSGREDAFGIQAMKEVETLTAKVDAE